MFDQSSDSYISGETQFKVKIGKENSQFAQIIFDIGNFANTYIKEDK